MPKNCKNAGTRRENDIKRILEAEGWVVVRAAASLGPTDLVAIRGRTAGGCEVLGIEAKANYGSPFMNFRAQDREEMRTICESHGMTPVLFFWPPHGRLQRIPVEDWPVSKKEKNDGA